MKRQQGMTLIEILIAMSLLSILTVMGYRAFGNLLSAREHIMQTGERWVQLARVLRRIEGDVQRLPRQWPQPDEVPALQLNGDSLLMTLGSARQPDGVETLRYQAGQGLTWQLQTPPDGTTYPLLATQYQVRWRVLASDGQWHGQWPVPASGSGEKLRARALEIRITMPQDETVQRVWSLP